MTSRLIACLALAIGGLCAGCSDDDADGSELPTADATSDSGDGDSSGLDVFEDAISDGSINVDSVSDSDSDSADDTADVETGAWADGILTTKELFDGNLIDTVVVEVDFEEGAEPQNGSGSLDWGYVRQSLSRVFQVSGAQTSIPTTLNQLQPFIVDHETFGDSYSVAEITDLSRIHRDTRDTGTSASFHVLYLDGYFEENNESRQEVLGVSLEGQRVVALFKPALDSVKLASPLQRGLIEETVLLHELGHSFGLVGLANGVPMIEDHEDPEHPGHDVDSECVMFWRNQFSSEVLSFVLSILVGADSRVVYCAENLRDIDAYSTPPRK